jgi:hypothetical protein
VNRSLREEFAGLLAGLDWEIALLQEAPPRWLDSLARGSGAHAALALTARNCVPPLQAALADWNPDLIASWEGGSNLTLVRGALLGGPDPAIAERRELVIHESWPERRTMAFTRLRAGLCVANLHATNDRPDLAGPEVLRAAELAIAWSGDTPLLFGGDFNLRPAEQPHVFDQLRDRHRLKPPTAERAIDHILARDLEIVEAPAALPHPEITRDPGFRGPLALWRHEAGRRIRLSDHAPVGASYRL